MPKSQKKIAFKTTLTKSPADSGWHFLVVKKEIVAKFGFEGKFKRVVCSINDAEGFQCALLPSGDLFYIIVNKKKRDSIGIVAGDTVKVELVKDESKYGLPMPEEFTEVLNQDPDGDRLFHALSAGKQRSLIYLVSNVSDIDKRIHVALLVVAHLKDNGGKVLGDQLYEETKRPIF